MREVRVSTKAAAYKLRYGMSEQEYFAYKDKECVPYNLSEEELSARHEEEKETLSQYMVARAKENAADYRTKRTREAIAKSHEIAAEEKRKATEETQKRIDKARALVVPVGVKRKAISKQREAALLARLTTSKVICGQVCRFVQRG